MMGQWRGFAGGSPTMRRRRPCGSRPKPRGPCWCRLVCGHVHWPSQPEPASHATALARTAGQARTSRRRRDRSAASSRQLLIGPTRSHSDGGMGRSPTSLAGPPPKQKTGLPTQACSGDCTRPSPVTDNRLGDDRPQFEARPATKQITAPAAEPPANRQIRSLGGGRKASAILLASAFHEAWWWSGLMVKVPS
jgi:hypothetical protein